MSFIGGSTVIACPCTTVCAVADLGGFLEFRGTPIFVVLRACVAGLVVENVLDSGTPHPPLSKSYRSATGVCLCRYVSPDPHVDG